MSLTKQQRQARERSIPFCTRCGNNKPRLGQSKCGDCLDFLRELNEVEELEEELNDIRGKIEDPAAGVAIQLLVEYVRLRLTGSRW